MLYPQMFNEAYGCILKRPKKRDEAAKKQYIKVKIHYVPNQALV
jgi:hypothetical protein